MLNRERAIHEFNNNLIIEKNGIKIQELPFINKINLRIDTNNKDQLTSFCNILNIILPTKSNTFAINEKIKVIWLGPNEWLIVSEKNNDLYIKLKNKMGDKEASVTDVSENRTIIRISGIKIFTLLSKFNK